MRALYFIAVGLHLLAAIFWIGGQFFLVLAVVPVLRQPAFRTLSPVLLQALGLRFRTMGWIAIGVLILTGLINLAARGVTLGLVLDPAFWQGAFGRALAGKLLAVVMVIGCNALHDFWAGPRATRALEANLEGDEAAHWRRLASWLARQTLLASLVAMAFALFMVRGWP